MKNYKEKIFFCNNRIKTFQKKIIVHKLKYKITVVMKYLINNKKFSKN